MKKPEEFPHVFSSQIKACVINPQFFMPVSCLTPNGFSFHASKEMQNRTRNLKPNRVRHREKVRASYDIVSDQ